MSGKQIGIFVILLIVFFPAAFIYLAVIKSKSKVFTTSTLSNKSKPVSTYDYKNSFPNDTVWVNKGSKVYHSDPCCADQTSVKGSDYMPLKKAQKIGCRPL